MATHSRKVFILLSLQQLSSTGAIERSFMVSDYDYSKLSSMKNDYILVCERTVSFEASDNIVGMAVEAMEQALSDTRAKHHAEQQAMIDSIARFRQLAAPVEGEVVDERHLTQRATVCADDADDAEDAEFKDLPF